jgi:hypothetical protein
MKHISIIFALALTFTACNVETLAPTATSLPTITPSPTLTPIVTPTPALMLNNPEFLKIFPGNEQIAKFNEAHNVYKISETEYGSDVKELSFREVDGTWYAHVTMGADMESNVHDWSIPTFQVRDNGDIWAGMSQFTQEGHVWSYNMEADPAGDPEKNFPYINVTDVERDEFGKAYDTYYRLKIDPNGTAFAKANLDYQWVYVDETREYQTKLSVGDVNRDGISGYINDSVVLPDMKSGIAPIYMLGKGLAWMPDLGKIEIPITIMAPDKTIIHFPSLASKNMIFDSGAGKVLTDLKALFGPVNYNPGYVKAQFFGVPLVSFSAKSDGDWFGDSIPNILIDGSPESIQREKLAKQMVQGQIDPGLIRRNLWGFGPTSTWW